MFQWVANLFSKPTASAPVASLDAALVEVPTTARMMTEAEEAKLHELNHQKRLEQFRQRGAS